MAKTAEEKAAEAAKAKADRMAKAKAAGKKPSAEQMAEGEKKLTEKKRPGPVDIDALMKQLKDAARKEDADRKADASAKKSD